MLLALPGGTQIKALSSAEGVRCGQICGFGLVSLQAPRDWAAGGEADPENGWIIAADASRRLEAAWEAGQREWQLNPPRAVRTKEMKDCHLSEGTSPPTSSGLGLSFRTRLL